MPSLLSRIERARPLLGTTVAIRVQHEEKASGTAQRAIEDAFDEVTAIHRLMSFQEPESDISRINREARGRTQTVDPATFEVLRWASEISEASAGCFDITIAPQLVAWGLLPAPTPGEAPAPGANWRDVELIKPCHVRFLRPLWIDVSGIAKGYAVDRAVAVLQSHGILQGTVNAGGDLRIFGPAAEQVQLRTGEADGDALPVLEVANAGVASSSGHYERRLHEGLMRGPHVDGRNREPVASDRFVTIVAPSCLLADALTKPVMILVEDSTALLQRFSATAHVFDQAHGWRHVPDEV